jgi:hypothetical protein
VESFSGFVVTGLIAVVLIAVTCLMMYEALRFSWRFMLASRYRHGRILYALGAAFAVHIASIWLYGFTYYFLATYTDLGDLVTIDATPDSLPFSLITCGYFSAATYTSLGFGDVIPSGHIRMISGAEALNGLLLIGWSVTFSFLAMEEFWERPDRNFPND